MVIWSCVCCCGVLGEVCGKQVAQARLSSLFVSRFDAPTMTKPLPLKVKQTFRGCVVITQA